MAVIAEEVAPGNAEVNSASSSEEQQVKCWLEKIEAARKFDSKARKDYALCRRYARGDSQFGTSVNLLGTYIDIMSSFLYARNPDVDCAPAERIQAGETDSEGPAQAPASLAVPPTPGGAMMDPALAMAPAAPILPTPLLPAPNVQTQPTGDDLTTLKVYGKSLEICLSKGWKDAKAKRIAKRALRSTLTIGVGWIKSGWQETYEADPTIERRRRDIQENLAKIEVLRREEQPYDEENYAELQLQLEAVKNPSEKIAARGLFWDFIPGEDIQVSLDVQNIVDCDVASWIAHRSFFRLEEAKAKFRLNLNEENFKTADIYVAVQPSSYDERVNTPHTDAKIDENSANRFKKGSDVGASGADNKYDKFVCVWEVWDAETNTVCDIVEGVRKYATPPTAPNVPTTRFYPFFPFALNEVDNERHPQSLVLRSYKLADDYNRARDGLSKMRQRIKPKTAFDARNMTETEVTKITAGDYAEWIPIKPASESLKDAIFEVPYPKFDAAIFDVTDIKNDIDMLWGIQDALSGSISVAKTATEAEIEQAGTNARTGSMRDTEEDTLTEIAQYNAEIIAQKYTLQDARDIAGPGAIWLEGLTIQDMGILLDIEIRAGSTGKPNTTREREAWAVTAPVLNAAIDRIGALVQADPREIARALTEVVRETVERSGDRIDVDRFLPRAGSPVMLVDPQTMQLVPAYPAAMPGATPGAPVAPGAGTLAPAGVPAPEGTAPTQLPEALRGGE